MSISPARLAANQRNALKSTGPTTLAGKARSRLNAFQHGLAGAGDILGPGEDADLVAARTEAFAAEFHAVGVAGEFLAHRVAVLSVRMDQAEADGNGALLAHVHAARLEFDAARVSELDRLVNLLTRRQAMHAARVELEQMPDGIDRLMPFWDRQHQAIEAQPDEAETRLRIGSLLALTDEQVAQFTPAQIIDRIEAERARLRSVDEITRAGRLAAIDRDRDAAGRAARLDPPREVIQIRRYDAAAERGFYRAVRAIQDLRRNADRANKEDRAVAQPVPSKEVVATQIVPPSVATPPALPSVPAPLGSFRAVAKVGPTLTFTAAASLAAPVAGTQPNRSARRAERKRAKNRR